METKFTPGVWKRDGVVIWGETRPIAQCVFLDARYPLESDSANAQLIAAAPDLYEALDEAINYVAVMCATIGDHSHAAFLDKATAALAKARGEKKAISQDRAESEKLSHKDWVGM